MTHINHIQIHFDNSCYVGYSDTDIQTDYFHGYHLSSIKKMIEWVKKDNQKIHQSDIRWVNDSNWIAEHKNKVLARLAKVDILAETVSPEKPQVYFNLNDLRFDKTFYMTKEGEQCQELSIDDPETLPLIKETIKNYKPIFCGESEARYIFANLDYEYWRISPFVEELLPNHY